MGIYRPEVIRFDTCDDTLKETKDQNPLKNVSTEDIRKEIEFSVDIQRKLKTRITGIWREGYDQNRKMLERFREDLNKSFQKMTMEVSLPVEKLRRYEDVINKFSSDCYDLNNRKFNRNDIYRIYKVTIRTNYEKLVSDLINVRNLN